MPLDPVLLLALVVGATFVYVAWSGAKTRRTVESLGARLEQMKGRLEEADGDEKVVGAIPAAANDSASGLAEAVDERFDELLARRPPTGPGPASTPPRLVAIRREAERTERLYVLLKDLLSRQLRAREPAPDVQQGQRLGDSAPGEHSSVVERIEPAGNDTARARRIARVMIEDLLLYNPPPPNMTNATEVRQFLASKYRDARETFEARVSAAVRGKQDYLEVELCRALRRRGGDPEEDAPANDNAAESADDRARRIARVMVEDLFLYNTAANEPGLTEEEIRKRLASHYELAVAAFEERVPADVRKGRSHLAEEYSRAIASRAAPFVPVAADPTDDSIVDANHVRAARLADEMVTSLILRHWHLVEEGVGGEGLQAALRTLLTDARSRFDALVPEAVRNQTHHLDAAFDRVLAEYHDALFDSEVRSGVRDGAAAVADPAAQRRHAAVASRTDPV